MLRKLRGCSSALVAGLSRQKNGGSGVGMSRHKDNRLGEQLSLARISHSPSYNPDFGQDVERKPDEVLRAG